MLHILFKGNLAKKGEILQSKIKLLAKKGEIL